MSILSLVDTSHSSRSASVPAGGRWQCIYRHLLAEPVEGRDAARGFLEECLGEVAELPCDLPETPGELHAWSLRGAEEVTEQYAAYLQSRRAGGGRLYFHNRAHAQYFLRSVAPTKLVDGAWLYGTLPHWRDMRVQPLVRTYLEELGDGVPGQNHVLLYRRLLAAQGCDDLSDLDDSLYLQGAIQLALGHLADDFLPEVIGYNLGYEQLPLHLLISAFELEELGIDPYYFLLHVTIDNSATGHAAKAVRAVLDNLPLVGDATDFYRRVSLGYRLNDLGVSSRSVIAGFDLETEVHEMLERKRAVAGQVHSDYCRIEGRTVNQWLASAEGIGGFLDALQRRGWIRRHQAPADSRFWSLVRGEGAAMFGVFSAFEQQLIHDWIAGDWLSTSAEHSVDNPFRKHRPRAALLSEQTTATPGSELEREQRLLRAELQCLDAAQREARLIELLAPVHHATPAGLAATRTFSALAY
ncbi:iron-containing redox enzyme family protein [Pseudomonas sp. GD03944]|uniref:iron-containing redox enzyme family protein n=1 Tax=Pseudomonas sp. GD03944 TaxID=2975409 RepID=UPI002448E4BD|nr:iron-containing redox enzyme family protein [Pseudomonas sp. GD03944]MDH1263519.1 iron-containing redox enzyme family protein [Pseudomonas sp. GD03944]